MATAGQVLHSLCVIYLGGCAISLALLVFRRVLTADHWHQVRKLQQHWGLSPALTAIMMINGIVYAVLRWPVLLVRHIRYRLGMGL